MIDLDYWLVMLVASALRMAFILSLAPPGPQNCSYMLVWGLNNPPSARRIS